MTVGATENAIDQAITAHAEVEGWTGIITGWVVLAATVDHDGEDERSGIGVIYPGGNLPWPFALGIVEAARAKLQHDFVNDDP